MKPFVRVGLLLLLLAPLAACRQATVLSKTPRILAEEAVDPVLWLFREERSNVVDLLYATDRSATSDPKVGVEYGTGRSKSLAFGECSVEIGRSIPWKKLMERSPRVRRRTNLEFAIRSVQERGRFPETPFPLTRTEDGGAVDDPATVAHDRCVADRFRAALRERLAGAERKEVFLFVHGYNNSFADAAFTQAEVWHFLGRPGVGIFYSWPAGIGGVRGYTHDRESGEFTNLHFKRFLRLLADCPEVERIHVLCHSRGTDVVTTALRELFNETRSAGKDPREVFRIENLVLAAPDMDMEVVTQRVTGERIQFGVERMTVYTSRTDKALGIADWLFRGLARAGRLGVDDLSATMRRNLSASEGVDVIQVTVPTDYIGHGYFHSDPSVSSDLVLLLRDGREIGAEHGRPLIPLASNFWELPEGYPDKMPEPRSR